MSSRSARAIIILLSACFIRCSSPYIVANQSVQLGDAMNNARQYDEAARHYSRYIEVSPQLGLYRNLKMEAEVCRKLAHVYSTQGKYAEAIKVLTKASNLDSLAGNKLEWIDDKRQIGMVHSYRKDYRSALRFVQEALMLSEGMENSVKEARMLSIADTHLSLSQLYLSVGDYQKAETHVTVALAQYEKVPGEFQGTIEALLIMGTLHRDKAELDQAIKYFARSKSLGQQRNLKTSRQDQAIGDIHLLRGNLDEAFRSKLSALNEAEDSKIKAQIVAANMQMGDLFHNFQDRANAEIYYRKAMAIESTMDDGATVNPSLQMRLGDVQGAYDQYAHAGSEVGLAMVNLKLAEIHTRAGRTDSALHYYRKAETFLQKINHKNALAKVRIEIGRLEVEQGNLEIAGKYFGDCARMPLTADLQWQLLLGKGVWFERATKKDSARECYERAILQIEAARSTIAADELKTLYSNNKIEVYERLILLLLSDSNPATQRQSSELAFDYNEKARSRTFLDMLGNRKIKWKNASDEALLEKEHLVRLRINKLAKDINADQPSIAQKATEELQLAQEEHQVITQQLKSSSAAYQGVINIQPPTLRQVQEGLDEETAIVEYWVGREKLVVWAVTRDVMHYSVKDIQKSSLRREILGTRNFIANKMFGESSAILAKLHGILLEPVERMIAKKKIVVVPHGPLHFLPFHALRKNNRYWIESAAITYAPSAASLLYIGKEKKLSGQKFLAAALGDSAIGEFPGLPGTTIEVSQLGQMYSNSDLLIGVKFTETFLKEHCNRYDYLHIATHGVLNKHQPLYSYLLMRDSPDDDGRLTVNEIFDLSIQSKMVTLSACETALGDVTEGDELTGMSRAFLFAGSRIVIVSLWKVDDATTSWLMTRFHQYMQNGRTAGEALASAQRDFINRNFTNEEKLKDVVLYPEVARAVASVKPGAASPYFWAPFVLVGDGDVRY